MLLNRTRTETTVRNFMYEPVYRGYEHTNVDYKLRQEPQGQYWKEGEPFGGYKDQKEVPLEWQAYIERKDAESFKREDK